MRRVAGWVQLEEVWRRSGAAGYLFLATAVLILLSGFINPGFVTPVHLLNLMRQAVPLGLVAIGQTLAILTAGVDLSVGSVVILTN
ncbi:MAG: ribose ABC transporter permease, partial [Bacillota bacterium]|nr:ribose ABC transporter permease [Bacillota bacterium]